jgi:hypothetical protein
MLDLTAQQQELQERLRKRLPEILREAKEIHLIYPDPVQALQDSGINMTQEIIEEPYG